MKITKVLLFCLFSCSILFCLISDECKLLTQPHYTFQDIGRFQGVVVLNKQSAFSRDIHHSIGFIEDMPLGAQP